jgi:hypothetical protein
MAEEERKTVRWVPNKGQDEMGLLPRAGALASWIRNTMTEMNKAYGMGLAIAAVIEAGGTCPCNEPGCGGRDIMAEAEDPFVKTAYRKLKQYQWVLREGNEVLMELGPETQNWRYEVSSYTS